MNSISSTIALELLHIKAIKLNTEQPFVWASGILSPIYCDNRKVLSYPSVRNLVKDSFVQLSEQFKPFQVVAGVATAGVPHGALLADALGLPFVYVRDKAKGHGMQNRIEGELRGNERVLVIEDLISTGGSSLEAVQALRNVGCTVVGVAAIFSYAFAEATANFAEADCPLVTLSNYPALLAEALRIGYISEAELATLNAWREDPKGWRV